MKAPTPSTPKPTPNKIRGITSLGKNDYALLLIVKDGKLKLMPLTHNRIIPQEVFVKAVTQLYNELVGKNLVPIQPTKGT